MQTMYMNKNTLLNYEHTDWLRAIDFYRDDLSVLQERLAEVSFKNNRESIQAGVEHFQNQFIIQKNNLDELRHYVNEHIVHVHDKYSKPNPVPGNELRAEHEKRKSEFQSLEKTMADLRHEFNTFLAKWM
jgi:t-SNARE complex subunit (syntaxin)